MNYSVFNPQTKRYDYYQTQSSTSATHASAPSRSLMAHQLGATPEQAAWSLSSSATKTGEGDLAIGRVAGRKSLIPFADITSDPIPWLLIAGGAYLWWRNRR